MKCPKCGGRMMTIEASFRAPRHDSCCNCGRYLEHPTRIVKPGIPPLIVKNRRQLSPAQREKENARSREYKRRMRNAGSAQGN